MDVRELRIGNWVIFNVDGTEIQYYLEYPHIGTLDQLSPIPLTEEWLERFGFEKSAWLDSVEYLKEVNSFFIKCFFHEGRRKPEYALFGNGGDDYEGEMRLGDDQMYVHKLQNLYYALTGEELTWQ